MGITTDKGELGEAEVIADLTRRGHGVAVPLGHSLPFDLVLIRSDDGELKGVQVKYTTSNGRVVQVRCASHSAWVSYYYTASQVDWIAVFDHTTDRTYYLHSCEWSGSAQVKLRVVPTANNQAFGIRWAQDHLEPVCCSCFS